ncbi:hypothetical protein IEQ34_013694 [Dendrobium chrysotoxum]|uniref:Uncharacterized protein n=1 Tax=Dendrobium chrysotoxum TaxID=161865 RepID=A0AAV7GRK7_DENCH|nr:hypothetical protein IEQ34_013694 [Dendrobium chrysotoxum]
MLRASLRFPPAPELLDIFKACGVALLQFLCRGITIIVGLIVFFRESGATSTVEYLSKMCKFTSDSYGRISCRANKNWLDFNEWGLPKKWDKLKELPSSLHVGEKDILRILIFSETESLQQELCYISQCVAEECLFKVGLSIQAGRSNATQLKNFEKVHKTTSTTFKRSACHPSEGQRVTNSSSPKNRKINDKVILLRDDGGSMEAARLPTIDPVSLDSDIDARSSRIHIPEKSLEEGFTRSFLKGVRLVHRKTGVDIEGLIPNQASEDSSPNSGDEDIESELKKALFSDDDDIDIA